MAGQAEEVLVMRLAEQTTTMTWMDRIEKLKRDYTDKYVVVDDARPELLRFKGQTGLVRTVNMNGRALVEFDANLNIGWYDIELDFLKVVDKPAPKETEQAKPAATKKSPVAKTPAAKSPAAKTPADGKQLSPLELARMQGGAKKSGASPGEKAASSDKAPQSTADLLAAARVKKGTPKASPAASPTETGDGKLSTTAILAAARDDVKKGAASEETSVASIETPPKKATAKKTPDRSKMSVADILAAARGGEKAGVGAASEPAEAAPPATTSSTTEEDTTPTEEASPQAIPETAPTESQPTPSPPTGEDAPVSTAGLPTDTAGIMAWCRSHDGK